MLLKINGVARLSRDPEQKFTSNGNSIVSFSIVSSEKYKDKEDTCFIECSVFGGLGEKVVMPYLKKGSLVYIVGKVKQDNWTAQDGSKKSKHAVVIESIEMLGSKDNSSNSGQGYQPKQQEQPKHNIPEIEIDDESIPF